MHVVQTLLAPAVVVGAFTSTSYSLVGTTSINNNVSIGMKSKDEVVHSPGEERTEQDCILELQPTFINRRKALLQSTGYLSSSFFIHPLNAQANDDEQTTTVISRGTVFEIDDPNTYSGVVYIPPAIKEREVESSYPLLVVLHGAGNNQNYSLCCW